MKELGMTQKELQEITGLRQNVISRIINEKVKTSISLETAKKFSKALGKSIEYLFPDN
ncbi:MAG: helix-turn-helix transcriptional regulator [Desulfitobacteriaceae bacterium]